MQDIPRNELLDKLAAGWKVRTKAYGKNSLNNLEELQGIDLKCLIKDDWEGEPPGPALLCKNTCIMTAFEELRDGAVFIRRTAWTKASICKNTLSLMCSVEDILATDWEVWG
jgi:hypothetical protein